MKQLRRDITMKSNWKYQPSDLPAGWKYFTLDELIHSDTADRLGINNTPTSEAVSNINDLVTNVLDRLRGEWGRPIIVTSGYRCKELNAAVGGTHNSQHLKGQAADIVSRDVKSPEGTLLTPDQKAPTGRPISDDFEAFRRFVLRWCRDNEFDQCIFEHSSDSEWIHISYVEGGNRRQMLYLNV